MVVFRVLGWLLLSLAVGTVVHDCLSWRSEGVFRLLTLGDLWSRLDLGSLNTAQAGLQHALSGTLWTGILAILTVPAFLAFVIGGLLCLRLGRHLGARRGEARFLGVSRPRRRRSRGLS